MPPAVLADIAKVVTVAKADARVCSNTWNRNGSSMLPSWLWLNHQFHHRKIPSTRALPPLTAPSSSILAANKRVPIPATAWKYVRLMVHCSGRRLSEIAKTPECRRGGPQGGKLGEGNSAQSR